MKRSSSGSSGSLGSVGAFLGLGGSAAKPAFPRPSPSNANPNRRSHYERQPTPTAKTSKDPQRALMQRMGTQLGYISKVFETELTGKTPETEDGKIVGSTYDETIVLQALAQLKQVRDVLSERIGEEDCFWLYSIQEKAENAPETEGDGIQNQ